MNNQSKRRPLPRRTIPARCAADVRGHAWQFTPGERWSRVVCLRCGYPYDVPNDRVPGAGRGGACQDCGAPLPPSRGHNPRRRCAECKRRNDTARNARWNRANPERVQAARDTWRGKNLEANKRYCREHYERRKTLRIAAEILAEVEAEKEKGSVA